ncbi:phosphodiesterase [Sneathiella limimaris]|uniref:phosphodiesterase n=1 Tax=Sneathiella limimaris TaxID=1964213 RepID=UPI00146F313A|nr:phosphodiesterase [Sneathiella limimaris]
MIIAQLSDPHVVVRGTEFHDLYKTIDKLQLAVDRVNNLVPRPDFIMLTGDLVNEGGVDEYAELKKVLESSKVPVYLGIGNHDCRETLRQTFGTEDYLPKEGFIQYAIEQEGLRSLMLDTNVHRQPYGTLCEERLAWLEKELSEHPDTPTLIFMHHPPFETGIRAMDAMGLRDAEKFGEVVARHPQIKRIFCGHLHRNISSEFYGVPSQICASTSHKVLLDLSEQGRLGTVDEPADILLHFWSPDAKTLVTHTSATKVPNILWEIDEYPS